MYKSIKQALVQIFLSLGLLAVVIPTAAYAVTHTLQFVQTPTTSLYNSLSSTATSMRITPYPKDLDGTKLTISDFGSTPTVTVDPKVKNYEEIISFTGITDNGDNTATLTGLSRDLLSKYPYTTSGTGKAHSAGATAVFSNNPQMYARLSSWENDGTITGLWTFTTSPTVPVPTTSGQAASKGYADSLALAGAPASSYVVPGIGFLATTGQAAASTASTTYNAIAYPNFLHAAIATSTCQVVGGYVVVASTTTGKIDKNCFDQTLNYSFSGGNLFIASTTLTATTSIAASNVNSKALNLNGVNYAFPASQGAASTYLQNNGSGTLTWASPAVARYTLSFGGATANNGYANTTGRITIPAGVMTASSTIQFFALVQSSQGTNNSGTFYISDSGGTILMSCSIGDTAASGGYNYNISGVIYNNSSLTSQTQYALSSSQNTSSNVAGVGSCGGSSSAFNTANALNIVGVMFSPAAFNFTLNNMVVTVNP